MIIAVDFDGTIVEHRYPNIGAPIPMALETLREWQESGHKIILWTVRNGKELEEAIDYLKVHGILPWGINENPTQRNWAPGPKAYAEIYIDDAALGCPLVQYPDDRPYVDWYRVREIMEAHLNDRA